MRIESGKEASDVFCDAVSNLPSQHQLHEMMGKYMGVPRVHKRVAVDGDEPV